MKKLIFAILCSQVISFSAFAQNTYEKIKTKAVENLHAGDFIAAKSRLKQNVMINHSHYNQTIFLERLQGIFSTISIVKLKLMCRTQKLKFVLKYVQKKLMS